jgi:hypothetical protein
MIFLSMLLLAALIYMCGLHGGFIFDDYPNIVDNSGLKPSALNVSELVRSALSSPSSELKRPLSSLSFAINYLCTGANPVAMKITNIFIHLLNGVLIFILAKQVLVALKPWSKTGLSSEPDTAALIAGLWLLLPINLTAVLYVVQRMESLANLFVVAGLVLFMWARAHMQTASSPRWPVLAGGSIVACTAFGLLAKETAVMLPMYAFVLDACLFGMRSLRHGTMQLDRRLLVGYSLFLLLPAIIGLYWLIPGLLNPLGWATRNFTLSTRLLTELRVVPAYIAWTLVPTPGSLSFYHDNWSVSTGLFSPWTTFAGAVALIILLVISFAARRTLRCVTVGVLLYLSAHLLTGTVLPLELVYEHRNYFASIGLLIAVVPVLADTASRLPLRLVRFLILTVMFVQSTAVLYMTSRAWDSQLTLAYELAARAPDSPRAQYELGRTYIIVSRYDPESPFIAPARRALEQAMVLPDSSILPEQALIFLSARMHHPIKDEWWDSMIRKLRTHRVTIQDESALGTLTQCMQSKVCDLPSARMTEAFLAAVNHESVSARLLAMYGDFAWNVLQDETLGLRMTEMASRAKPTEPAYLVTMARMLVASGKTNEAKVARDRLAALNVGGSLDADVAAINRLLQP